MDEPDSLNLRFDKYTGIDVELRRNSVQDTDRRLGARLELEGGDEAKLSSDWIRL